MWFMIIDLLHEPQLEKNKINKYSSKVQTTPDHVLPVAADLMVKKPIIENNTHCPGHIQLKNLALMTTFKRS